MRGRIFGSTLAVVAVLTTFVLVGNKGGGGTPTPTPTTMPTPTATPSTTCNQTATNSSQLTTAVAAATTGQVVCLTASSSYGTWTGTNKAITLMALSGTGGTVTSPTLALTLGSGDSSFTIDGGMARWDSSSGMSITGCTCGTGITNVTLKNFKSFNGSDRAWNFSQPPDSGFVIDHAHFFNWVTGEAAIYVDHSLSEPSDTGITIKNSLFRHFSDDGIKLAGDNGVTILNNKMFDFLDGNGVSNHTDAIQLDGGERSVIKGNVIYDSDACVSGYDGMGSAVIEHNEMWNCTSSGIQTAADSPASTVAWNTVGPTDQSSGDNIQCGNAPGKPAIHSLTNVYDNATFGGVILDDGSTVCTPTRNDHNVSGTITLVVGTNTTTHMATATSFGQLCVASGTALTAADDGGQVGACGGDYNGSNYGPPSGQGF